MRERHGDGRIGVVVGRHVHGLHRRDRALVRGRDALFERAHVGRKGRLISHRGRHAAHQRRDFRARLQIAEDVVHEQQHVGAEFVAEVFGHGHAGLRDPKAHARRLVHLAEDQGGLREHARLFHFQPKVVAFTRALADAGEHREAFVHGRDVADELLNQDGLADARTADLDAGFEEFGRGILRFEFRRRAVDRPARRRFHGLVGIDRLAQHVEDASERAFADGNRDRAAGRGDGRAAHETVGRSHRETAHLVVAQIVLHFQNEIAGLHRRAAELGAALRRGGRAVLGRVVFVDAQRQRVVEVRKRVLRKLDVHDVSEHLNDLTGSVSHDVNPFSFPSIRAMSSY